MSQPSVVLTATASGYRPVVSGALSLHKWLLPACLVCEGDKSGISDIPNTLAYFNSLEWLFYGAGIIMLVLGFMAWSIHKKNSHRHSWGKRIFGIGLLFTAIGFNMGAFFSLIKYVLG